MKRGQSAFEFLTTYGWMILAAMVCIGALFQFGIINPKAWKSDNCWFDAGITCLEYGTAAPNRAILVIANDFREDITVTDVKYAYSWKGGNCIPPDKVCIMSGNLCGAGTTPIPPGSKRTITVTCGPPNPPKKFDVNVNFTYRKTDFGKYDKIVEGKAELTMR